MKTSGKEGAAEVERGRETEEEGGGPSMVGERKESMELVFPAG